VDRVPERNADRVALRFELAAADTDVLPGVGFHPDLVPQILAVEAREVDVEIREGGPGLAEWVPGDLAADLRDLAVLLLELVDEAGEIHQVFFIQVRSAGAGEVEQVVSCPGRYLGGGARRNLQVRNVVDRDGDAVLLTPVLGKGIEPGVV